MNSWSSVCPDNRIPPANISKKCQYLKTFILLNLVEMFAGLDWYYNTFYTTVFILFMPGSGNLDGFLNADLACFFPDN